MIPKECQPACDFRCNQAPELDLECEACPGRNEAKPMPGAVIPSVRIAMWVDGEVQHPFGGFQQGEIYLKIFEDFVRDFRGYNAWIQFERNGMC